MSTQLIPLDVISDAVTHRALFAFLARYRGDTLRAYQQDLKAYLAWCRQHDLQPPLAQRPHLELYLRWMEQRGYAAATIGRRSATVAGFYRYAVIDGHLPVDPTLAVIRPSVPWEGQRRAVLHPLEFAALLTAARRDGPHSHALITLLGMIGLRVGEVCRISVTDLREQAGYELLSIIGKGNKPAVIPLPIPVLRSVRDAVVDRTCGPLLLNRNGERFRRASVAARITRLAATAGLTTPVSPHGLRRTFCTSGLIARVPLRALPSGQRVPSVEGETPEGPTGGLSGLAWVVVGWAPFCDLSEPGVLCWGAAPWVRELSSRGVPVMRGASWRAWRVFAGRRRRGSSRRPGSCARRCCLSAAAARGGRDA
jgi:integrase/recombinase XerD